MANAGEQQYLDLLRDILDHGLSKDDRTGTGTRSVFGRQIRFDLSKGFPLLTTKKVFLKAIIYELLWFLSGESNIRPLLLNNVHIWDDWPYRDYCLAQKSLVENTDAEACVYTNSRIKVVEADETLLSQPEFIQKIKDDEEFAKKWGDLGPVYGVQWRHWKTLDGKEIDQIKNLIDNIKDVASGKSYKTSRRLIISAWNPTEVDYMALPPCHLLFQFYVLGGKLSCQLYQRSADVFLGVPFNIASYALFTMMVAQVCGLEAGDFVHTFGDVHIYNNHIEQVNLQLSREPRDFPIMKINPEIKDIFSFTYEDFTLENYNPHPAIKAPVAV